MPLKWEECQKDEAEGDIRESQGERKVQPLLLALRIMELGQEPRNVSGLKKLRMRTTPRRQPAGKEGPQSYNHMELDADNNLNEPGNGYPSPTPPSPEPPEGNAALLTSWFQPMRLLRRAAAVPGLLTYGTYNKWRLF